MILYLQPEFNEIGTGPNMNDYLIYTHGRMRRMLGLIVYFYTTSATWTKSHCSVSFTPSVPSYLIWMLLQHAKTEPATSINEIGTRPNMNGFVMYIDAYKKLTPFLQRVGIAESYSSAVYSMMLSVCPSVCPPSHSGVLSRWMKLRSCGFHQQVAHSS